MANVNKTGNESNQTGNVSKGPVNNTGSVNRTGGFGDAPRNTAGAGDSGDYTQPVDNAPVVTPESVPAKKQTQKERQRAYLEKHNLPNRG